MSFPLRWFSLCIWCWSFHVLNTFLKYEYPPNSPLWLVWCLVEMASHWNKFFPACLSQPRDVCGTLRRVWGAPCCGLFLYLNTGIPDYIVAAMNVHGHISFAQVWVSLQTPGIGNVTMSPPFLDQIQWLLIHAPPSNIDQFSLFHIPLQTLASSNFFKNPKQQEICRKYNRNKNFICNSSGTILRIKFCK
jgi:hypothetical protein